MSEVCEAKLFDEDHVDNLVREFVTFQENVKKTKSFADFPSSTVRKSKSNKESVHPDRLDKLYYSYFHNGNHKSEHLWPFIAMLLLSHGQATVERGFSINNHVTEVNQSEGSLQAKRMIKDHFRHIGGFQNVIIDNALINKAKTARMKYRQKLEKEKEERKKEMEKTSQSRKRKEMADEKEELNAKRRKLAKDIDRLEIHADSNIQIAAETGNLGLMKNGHEKKKRYSCKKSGDE